MCGVCGPIMIPHQVCFRILPNDCVIAVVVVVIVVVVVFTVIVDVVVVVVKI